MLLPLALWHCITIWIRAEQDQTLEEPCGGSGAVTWCHALHMFPGLTAHCQCKILMGEKPKPSYNLCQQSHGIMLEAFISECCRNLPRNSHREWEGLRVSDLPHILARNWIYCWAGLYCGVQLTTLPCLENSLLCRCHSQQHDRCLSFLGAWWRTIPVDLMEDVGLIQFWDNTLVVIPRHGPHSQGYTCILNLRLILPLLLGKFSISASGPHGAVPP